MKTKHILLILTGIYIMFTNQTFASNNDVSSNVIENSTPSGEHTTFRNNVPIFNSITDAAVSTWKFLFSGHDRTPAMDLPTQRSNLIYFNTLSDNQLNVTWLGHSSLMINIDGYKILTDPVFEKRVSIVGPERFNGEVPIDIAKLPLIDVVIISHNHYDHLNKFTIDRLKSKTRLFIVPMGMGKQIAQWGISEKKIIELDWWQNHIFDSLTVTATPAQHFSGRGLFDRNKTLWASWAIRGPHHNVFFSGDSGYFSGFEQIGSRLGPFDMTFLECGAYNPAWHSVHMYPEETVAAHLDLKGRILMPIHWATFNLSIHPWYEPILRLTQDAESADIRISTPMVGETTVYDTHISDKKWWEPVIAKNNNIKGGL
jgi:L-ascorbate metabolism protein UlaG (beta-lactamase superfamily)